MNSKKGLRKQLKALHEAFDEDSLAAKSLQLQRKIISLEEYKKAKSIFCYISFGREIGTGMILDDAIKNGKILTVPLITGKRKMAACRIEDLDHLVENGYGIMEPHVKNEIPKEIIDLAIVPALGFNADGYRIGFGGGFYDIYLKDYEGMSIGMTFREFIVDFYPDDYDIPVKKLIIL